MDTGLSRKFDAKMSSLTSLLATHGVAGFLVPGAVWDDPVAVLPSVGLFLLGLAVGWLGRRRGRDAAPAVAAVSTGSAPEPSPGLAGLSAPVDRAIGESRADAERSAAWLEGELLATRSQLESQAGEILLLSDRIASLRGEAADKDRRLEEWQRRIGGLSGEAGSRRRLAEILPTVARLGEAIQGESGRVGAWLARLERLERRLGEEDERFRTAGEKLARARDDVGARLADTVGSGPAWFALADRLSKTEEEVTELGARVTGCRSRIGAVRARFGEERIRLDEAAGRFQEVEARLPGPPEGGVEGVVAWPALREGLERVGEAIARLAPGIDREASEAVGGVETILRDALARVAAGWDRHQESEAGGDFGVSLLESRVWRDLNDLKGSLKGVRVTLETGAFLSPADEGARERLVDLSERALASVREAAECPEPEVQPSGAEESAAAAAAAAGTGASDPGNGEREARDRELAAAREELGRAEAERESLLETVARLEKALAEARSVVPAGLPEPEGRESGLPGAFEAKWGATDATRLPAQSGSRQFIRRLLGLGPGKWEEDLDAAGRPAAPAVSAAAPTLAEARAVVGELRRLPVSRMASPRTVPGERQHHSLRSSQGTGVAASDRPTGDEREAEIRRLTGELLEREARIARLEQTLETRQLPEGAGEAPPETPETEALAGSRVPAGAGPDIIPGDRVPPGPDEVVVFRGADPRAWNTRTPATGSGSPSQAISLADLPASVGYLRLVRLDTGESVVAPISREELLAGGSVKTRSGWSGRAEPYFGALHLGLFDESLPREVQIRFGAGGWGFGHREGVGSGQAFAWAGRAIEEPGEGFEIRVGPEERLSGRVAPGSALTLADPSGGNVRPAETRPTDRGSGVPAPASPDLAALEAQSDNRVAGLVLFRSNDPGLWGREFYGGGQRRSRSLDRLPAGLAYLRLRRLDTGEGIVARVTNDQLGEDGDGLARGFNGSNESYYGARHLGLFDEALPQDFETRFTFGGWGFGHAAAGPEGQASGWAGRVIPSHTVFEFAVFRRMPVLGERDRLLGEPEDA